MLSPSTTLHEEGGWNWEQLSQRCAPFGVSWQATSFCSALASARFAAIVVAMRATPLAATPTFRRRERRESCDDRTFGLSSMISPSSAMAIGLGTRSFALTGTPPRQGANANRLLAVPRQTRQPESKA